MRQWRNGFRGSSRIYLDASDSTCISRLAVSPSRRLALTSLISSSTQDGQAGVSNSCRKVGYRCQFCCEESPRAHIRGGTKTHYGHTVRSALLLVIQEPSKVGASPNEIQCSTPRHSYHWLKVKFRKSVCSNPTFPFEPAPSPYIRRQQHC